MVPNAPRKKSNFLLPPVEPMFCCFNNTKQNVNEIAHLKKTTSITGKWFSSLAKTFIAANHNVDCNMCNTPLLKKLFDDGDAEFKEPFYCNAIPSIKI
jgi:hypothetical protein